MSLTVSKTEYTLHPEGHFDNAKIIDVQEEEGNYGPQVKFVVRTNEKDENENYIDIWHFCSQNFSKKSKLGKTVTGILGCKFDGLPDDFDLEKLLDKTCQITVQHAESKSGKEYAKIVSFLPANGKSELSDDDIKKIKSLMSKNNVDMGVLENLYDVDAVEKLSKKKAEDIIEKMKSGDLSFVTPDSEKDDVDIDGIPF